MVSDPYSRTPTRVALALAPLLALAACGQQNATPPSTPSASANASSSATGSARPTAAGSASAGDPSAAPGASASAEELTAAPETPADDDDDNANPAATPSAGGSAGAPAGGAVSQIIALGTWVPVRREPRRDAPLMGYLRGGAITNVTGTAVTRERCPVRPEHPNGGWFHLTGGGYVCVGGALAVPYPVARGVSRPVQPAPDGGMPYEYAIVYGNANLYSHPPSRDEMRQHESWRARADAGASAAPEPSALANARRPAASATPSSEPGGETASPEPSTPETAAPTEAGEPSDTAPAPRPSAAPVRRASAQPSARPSARPEPRPEPRTAEERRRARPDCDPLHHRCLGATPTRANDRRQADRRGGVTPSAPNARNRPAQTASNARVRASEPARPENDGRPQLRDLRGERGSAVIRRLLSGMYVALDRVVADRTTGERYWRTQSGGYIRTGPLSLLRTAPTFTGVVLDEAHTLPYAFMVSLQGGTYRLGPNGRGVSYHRASPRLSTFALTSDPPITVGTQVYYRTTDGLAVNARNVRIAKLRPPPAGTGPTEKWIDVDLDQQVLVAYEGARPVYTTLVSTGRRSDAHANYDTPAGSFRIRGKHISTTMDGDTAADGPYSIEDVPWAMYFFENYALHGAFWHNNFGWRMSHGCVNLSPPDARWIFGWADPQLPEGWHGVFASTPAEGSRVELHHGDRPTPSRPQR